MKHLLAVLIIMLACRCTLLSQTTINFCTAVDKEYCYFNNTQFISPTDSTQAVIYMLIKNAAGFNTTNLQYQLYSVDKSGKELKYKTLDQACDRDWTWAWKSEMFSSPGKYTLKLYNEQQQLVNSKSFELILPKR